MTKTDILKNALAFAACDRDDLSGDIRMNLRQAICACRTLTKRIAELEADQSDWRKGVGLIAAAVGADTLDCVDLHERVLVCRARVEELEAIVGDTYASLMALPELNMSNYSEDDAERLNDGVCEVCCSLENEAVEAAKEA